MNWNNSLKFRILFYQTAKGFDFIFFFKSCREWFYSSFLKEFPMWYKKDKGERLPLNPFPLVTPMMSTISSFAKVLLIGTFFSKSSRANSTLSEMEPPLIWTSTMCAFFWRRLKMACWVWKIPRTTWQYFLIWEISFSISFLPVSSFHLRQAFVKAFFLDLDLYFEKHTRKI